MYSVSDHFAHNAQKMYSGVKRATVTCTALFTLASTTAVTAAEPIEINVASSTPQASLNLKYRAAPAESAIPGKYIVVFKDDYVMQEAVSAAGGMSVMSDSVMAMQFKAMAVSTMADNLAHSYSAQIDHNYFATISGFSATMDQKNMMQMLNDDSIAFIEQDQMMYANATQTGATWGLDRIDETDRPLDGNYTYSYDGSGVTAYIVDTGIAPHSNFGNRLVEGFSAVSGGTTDCNGHGTHVAGTVGSSTWGVAKNVTLVPVRVLGCNGSGSNSGVIAGVDYVRQNASGPSVANMSLGGGASSALDNAITNAVNSGVPFAVAAGNETQNACNVSPARAPAAITVGSTTSSDSRSSFSNYGSCVDILAPGSSITSTWINGGTNTISGTSMASPHAAGVVALYLDQYPNASPSQVVEGLTDAAAVGKISGVNGSPNLLLQSYFDGPQPSPTTTPSPSPSPTPTPELSNGVPVIGLSATEGNDVVFTMNVPSDATDVSFSISGGSGDADLYVRFGSEPTDNTYDCRPYDNGNSETCDMADAGGTYYVRVKAYSSFSGVTLVGSYEGSVPPSPTPTPTPTATPSPSPSPSPTPGPGPDPIDETVTGVSASTWGWARYSLDLSEGYSSLVVTTSGGSGDADLYLNFGSQSSLFSYDCRSNGGSNSETCVIENPPAGVWHIDVRAYRTFSGVTLNVKAN